MEDATQENGCLSFAAGSHKRAPIKKRFVRTGEPGSEGTGFMDNKGGKFPKGLETETNGMSGEEDYEIVDKEEEYTMGEVKAGTLVLIR